MLGTITLADGSTRNATRLTDGSVVFSALTNATVKRNHPVERKATPKQARTFVGIDWIVDVKRAEVLAYAEMSQRGIKVLADIVKAEMSAQVAYARIRNFAHLADVAPTASARAFWTRKATELQAA